MKQFLFRVGPALFLAGAALLLRQEFTEANQPGNDVLGYVSVAGVTYKASARDIAQFSSNAPHIPGMIVSVPAERIINLQSDGVARRFPAISERVGQALQEAGVTLSPLDRVEPSQDAPIIPEMNIKIVRISEEERVERVPVPFKTIVSENADIPWGRRTTLLAGVAGMREERVRLRLENGSAVSRTVLSAQTIAEPTAEQIEIGTKITVGRVVGGTGSWYSFKRGMFAAATIFPRGTFLRVTNLWTNKQVIVEINDYGPTAPGRVIDLEAAAFRALGTPLWRGLIPVKVEEILR